MAFVQAHELQAVAGNVANAQHRIAGDRAAENLEMPPFQARGGQRERFAALSSLLTASSALAASAGSSQAAKASTRRGLGASVDQREFALDARLGVRPIPGDDDLRFAGQKKIGAVEFGARALQLVGELALVPGPAIAADQMQHGRQYAEQQQQAAASGC